MKRKGFHFLNLILVALTLSSCAQNAEFSFDRLSSTEESNLVLTSLEGSYSTCITLSGTVSAKVTESLNSLGQFVRQREHFFTNNTCSGSAMIIEIEVGNATLRAWDAENSIADLDIMILHRMLWTDDAETSSQFTSCGPIIVGIPNMMDSANLNVDCMLFPFREDIIYARWKFDLENNLVYPPQCFDNNSNELCLTESTRNTNFAYFAQYKLQDAVPSALGIATFGCEGSRNNFNAKG